MQDTYYFDATDLVMGRISSHVVPLLLGGKRVVIINAEKAVVSGSPSATTKKYLQLRARRVLTNPKRGPFFPRFPDRILRRTVRGMLPYKTTSGREAFKRLSVFMGVPDKYGETEFQTVPKAKYSFRNRYMTLADLGRALGWRYGMDQNY